MDVMVFTGGRSDYGLLRWLILDLHSSEYFNLQLVVSGSHLSDEYGMTVNEIYDDGFSVAAKVDVLLSSNSSSAAVKSCGLVHLGLSEAIERLGPDLIFILGDRYEALAAAHASVLMRVPVFHLHGGETTLGAYDDAFRHAITCLSAYHGVSCEEHRKKVLSIGADNRFVYTIGAMGLDQIRRGVVLESDKVQRLLGISFDKPYFLVTFHPVTAQANSDCDDLLELLAALDHFSNYQIVFTAPNADDGSGNLLSILSTYVEEKRGRAILIRSFGHQNYLSILKDASVIIGNSSSGIIEAPSVFTPTVNVGDRQKGRVRALSVIDCSSDRGSVIRAIHKSLDKEFLVKPNVFKNPYDSGRGSEAVMEVLKTIPLKKSLTN
jgi:UDP-hydrolysing UDP-N-acetyl-D-glucosamine 2-epimerase